MSSILFVCDAYGKYASPNGICIKNIAKQAVKEGHSVFIIAKRNKKDEKIFEMEDGIFVSRIKISRLEFKINNLDRNNIFKKILLKISAINGALHIFSYPKLYSSEIRHYYKQIKRIINKNNIEYLVCVYKQIHGVLAALKMKKKNPNIKLVTYTLDCISGGYIPSICRNKKIPLKSILKWEGLIFKQSDYIFAMTSHMDHYLNQKYDFIRKKILFVDIPLLEERRHPVPILKKDCFNIVFTGSMSENTANPIPLLYFFKNSNIKHSFNLYGRITDNLYSKIEKMGLIDESVFFNGPVSHDEALLRQNNADVLVNFGNENKNMIPCKIFEYMSTGKKILSISPSELDPSISYLKLYPNSMILYPDDFLKDNIDLKIQSFFEAKLSDINVFNNPVFKKCTAKYFLECLLTLK